MTSPAHQSVPRLPSASLEGGPLLPDELLSTTRTVRKRLDLERPVERSVIDECLRLAFQAPTGGNSQGWGWVLRSRGLEILSTSATGPRLWVCYGISAYVGEGR
jgi:hypothetical protein